MAEAGFFDNISQLAAQVPTQIYAGVGIGVGGVVLAFVLRPVARWLVRRTGLEALAERVGIARLLYKVGVKKGFAHVCAQLTFVLTLLLTGFLLSEVLQLQGVSKLFAALAAYMPNLLAAAAVLTAGLLGAEALQRIARAVLEKREDIDSPEIVAKGIYGLVVVLTAPLAIEQLGVEIGLINGLIQIAAAAAGLGLALAFGLGARAVFQNLIARHYARRFYRPGDRIGLGDIEGTILAFNPTGVIVHTDEGEVVLPCHKLLEGVVSLKRAE